MVIAPEQSQSGKAHAITMFPTIIPDTARSRPKTDIYACSGTPVDCVKMGYDYLFADELPALNISGINHGSNAAINVLYSGTMGAAIEASFYGAPSIGLSLTDHAADADFDASALFAEQIIGDILGANIDGQLCLNCNIPVARPEEICGHRICRQTRGFWKEEFLSGKDPRGKDYFWLTGDFCNAEPEAEDTDEWALKHNYISIVPVSVDLTHYGQLSR